MKLKLTSLLFFFLTFFVGSFLAKPAFADLAGDVTLINYNTVQIDNIGSGWNGCDGYWYAQVTSDFDNYNHPIAGGIIGNNLTGTSCQTVSSTSIRLTFTWPSRFYFYPGSFEIFYTNGNNYTNAHMTNPFTVTSDNPPPDSNIYTTLFSDNFTDSDGTTWQNHNSIYTKFGATDNSIQNNQAVLGDGDNVNVPVFSNGCVAADVPMPASGNLFLGLRDNGGNSTPIYAYLASNGDVGIQARNEGGGLNTVILPTSGTINFKFCIDNDTAIVYYNGHSFASLHLTAGDPVSGIPSIFGSGSVIDNLVVAGITSSPTPTPTPTPTPSQNFTVSNATANHITGDFSFDYTGYSGGGIVAVSLRNDNTATIYNWPAGEIGYGPLSCSGTHCSGTPSHLTGVISCSDSLLFDIFDGSVEYYSQSFTVSDIDPSCSVTPTPTNTPTPTPVPNVPPVVGAITVVPNPVQVNVVTSATASFTDGNPGDTHTAEWNWGDGFTSPGDVIESNGTGSVSGSHVYLTSGVYTVTLTVTDNQTASDTETFKYVSVYNPTPQGLFSGARIFQSPAGALLDNPTVTGQVKFGVTSKYQNGVPTGNVSMDFKAANFTFNSTAVTVLVTVGGEATLRGEGTIQSRSGTFDFLVTGIDGASDKIRFQITDPSNNDAVVYDSQLGAEDTADPTTAVTGQVIVH